MPVPQTTNILLIEDHERLAGFVRKGLENAQFSVSTCTEGRDGLLALESGNFDATILDLGLPDMDGMELLRELRESGNPIPVLILTSRIGVTDRVEGLNIGADDYLVKPFDMNELVARLHALLRRPSKMVETTLQVGNVTLEPGAREVHVDGLPVDLSRRESGLLEQLMRRVGKVVPKTHLEELLYGVQQVATSNSLEVMVHRLRKKLLDAGSHANILTVRGVGYMMIGNGA